MGSMFPRTKEEREEYEYYKEYWSHPENVEKERLHQIECVKRQVGENFYNSHTKEEVDAELERLGKEFRDLIANTDVTYLYKRPYPTQVKP